MNIVYNEDEKLITITEKSTVRGRSSTVKHSFSGTPLVVQLHPVSNKVIRCYFSGKRPGFFKSNARKYKTNQVIVGEGKLGWWISSWESEADYILKCPTVEGAIIMLSELLPDELEAIKKKILTNIDIIKLNIRYDATYYKKFGFHFKLEEISGVAGAMCLDKTTFRTQNNYEEHADWVSFLTTGPLPQLVEELITPLEYDDEFLLGDNPSFDWEEDSLINDNGTEESVMFYEDHFVSTDSTKDSVPQQFILQTSERTYKKCHIYEGQFLLF